MVVSGALVAYEYHGSTYKDYGPAYDYYGTGYEQHDDYGLYGPAAYSESVSRGRGGGRAASAGMHRGTPHDDSAVCQSVCERERYTTRRPSSVSECV